MAASLATRRSVRKLSVRAQLVLFSVLLVFVAAGGSALAGWQIVEGLIRQATTDRLPLADRVDLYDQFNGRPRPADGDLWQFATFAL